MGVLMRKILVSLMPITLFATTANGAGEVDPACVAKAKSAAHAASLEAASQMNDIEFVFHNQTQDLDLTHKKPVITLESSGNVSLLNAQKHWLFEEDHKKLGKGGVYVMNEEYQFTVARVKNDEKNGYKLVKAFKNDALNSKQPLGNRSQIVQNILWASYDLLGLSLSKALTGPDFQLVVAKFIGEGMTDDRPIRLELLSLVETASAEHPGSFPTKGARYWAELGPGPGMSFMIKRCGFKTLEGIEINKDIEYQPFGQGAFPKTIAMTVKIPDYTHTETLTIEAPHACTRSDSEFYLTHYGISESVVDVTRTNPWIRTAAIVLSLLGVALSIYLYRSSRRSSGPKAAPG